MTEPRDLPHPQTSPELLAAYISKAVAAADMAGKDAILVRVPEAFPLPLWEARQIISALDAVKRAEAAEARVARLLSIVERFSNGPPHSLLPGGAHAHNCPRCLLNKEARAALAETVSAVPQETANG